MKSCSYAHNRRMSHPRMHLQRVGSPDTEDNDRVRHPQTGNDRNQKDTDWNGILKKTRSSVICSFRICSLSWSAQGNRWWEGLRWSHRYANQEQNNDERLCGDQHSSHPLGSWSKNLISGRTCHPFIPVCTGSVSGMQNPLANFIGVFS